MAVCTVPSGHRPSRTHMAQVNSGVIGGMFYDVWLYVEPSGAATLRNHGQTSCLIDSGRVYGSSWAVA